MHNLPINKWSEDDRPREKLVKKGVNALSDAELIAILIGSGSRSESAVELSKKILNNAGNNLDNLGSFTIKNLMQFKGIGQAKAISIIAALEIGRRHSLTKALQRKTIKSSQDAFELLSPNLSDKTLEEFWLILMKKDSVIDIEQIHKGGLDSSLVDIRLLMKRLLEKNATGFIIAHNHPSGNLTASPSDQNLTQKIKAAANLLNLQLLDHLIIANTNYFSFSDAQIL